MAEQRPESGSAQGKGTPLERARTNADLRDGFLKSLAARLRGEKPIRATELMELLDDAEVHRGGGGR